MAHIDHRPDDNFEGLIASIETKLCYGQSLLEVHTYLTDLGLTSEHAHLMMRAAGMMTPLGHLAIAFYDIAIACRYNHIEVE